MPLTSTNTSQTASKCNRPNPTSIEYYTQLGNRNALEGRKKKDEITLRFKKWNDVQIKAYNEAYDNAKLKYTDEHVRLYQKQYIKNYARKNALTGERKREYDELKAKGYDDELINIYLQSFDEAAASTDEKTKQINHATSLARNHAYNGMQVKTSSELKNQYDLSDEACSKYFEIYEACSKDTQNIQRRKILNMANQDFSFAYPIKTAEKLKQLGYNDEQVKLYQDCITSKSQLDSTSPELKRLKINARWAASHLRKCLTLAIIEERRWSLEYISLYVAQYEDALLNKRFKLKHLGSNEQLEKLELCQQSIEELKKQLMAKNLWSNDADASVDEQAQHQVGVVTPPGSPRLEAQTTTTTTTTQSSIKNKQLNKAPSALQELASDLSMLDDLIEHAKSSDMNVLADAANNVSDSQENSATSLNPLNSDSDDTLLDDLINHAKRSSSTMLASYNLSKHIERQHKRFRANPSSLSLKEQLDLALSLPPRFKA